MKNKQRKLCPSLWREISNYDNDPLSFVIKMVKDMNNATGPLIREFITSDVADLSNIRDNVISNIKSNQCSIRITYLDINPECSLHHSYTNKHTINEDHRISFTRFRASEHALTCESGRWSRCGRGRLPMEESLCRYGQVQTETHGVQDCPLIQHIIVAANFETIKELLSDGSVPEMNCKIIHDISALWE